MELRQIVAGPAARLEPLEQLDVPHPARVIGKDVESYNTYPRNRGPCLAMSPALLHSVAWMGKRPVFLFAYANDLADDRRYLRNLPEERRQVKDALRSANEKQRCEVIQLANATVDEVLNECQRDSRHVSVLHFAGHADGKTLLFEARDGGASATDAGSIAEFLGGLRSLKLVVLNGCSTSNQVNALLQGGVPAVVATSTTVKDHIATEFAARFYRALAKSATIADAFGQASGAVKATLGAHASEGEAIRAVTRDVELPRDGHTLAPHWPWKIYGERAALEATLLPARTTFLVAFPIVGVALLAGVFYGAWSWTHDDAPPHGGPQSVFDTKPAVDAALVEPAVDANPSDILIPTGAKHPPLGIPPHFDERGCPIIGAGYATKIDSIPQGAAIHLTSAEGPQKACPAVGATPWEGKLNEGHYMMTVEALGYDTATRSFEVAKVRKTQEVLIRLVKKLDEHITLDAHAAQVESKVKKIIGDILEVPSELVRPDLSLIDDLKADSIAIVELVVQLEKDFLIMIPCEDAPPFKTVIDTINYIKTHTK